MEDALRGSEICGVLFWDVWQFVTGGLGPKFPKIVWHTFWTMIHFYIAPAQIFSVPINGTLNPSAKDLDLDEWISQTPRTRGGRPGALVISLFCSKCICCCSCLFTWVYVTWENYLFMSLSQTYSDLYTAHKKPSFLYWVTSWNILKIYYKSDLMCPKFRTNCCFLYSYFYVIDNFRWSISSYCINFAYALHCTGFIAFKSVAMLFVF